MSRIELAVLDMAGTTVRDDGAVVHAFVQAATRTGLAADDTALQGMLDYVHRTMGTSKIDVFTHLCGGDEQQAARANAAFESAYASGVADGGCTALPGASESFARLRDAGIAVVLTTGFARSTAGVILDALDWRGLIDLSLTPAEAGRGRPYPDLPLTALLHVGASSVQSMAVLGDTASDVDSGRRAGARICAGVLTGAHDARQLSDAGATHVVADVTEFADLVLSL